MPPELIEIQNKYNQILDMHEQGQLSYEDTAQALEEIQTVDGAGYLWTIDSQTGDFLRAMPGSVYSPALAAEFAPHQDFAPWDTAPFPHQTQTQNQPNPLFTNIPQSGPTQDEYENANEGIVKKIGLKKIALVVIGLFVVFMVFSSRSQTSDTPETPVFVPEEIDVSDQTPGEIIVEPKDPKYPSGSPWPSRKTKDS